MKGSPLPVIPSQSGTRLLRVLEGIARQQAIGVRSLARHLDDDKSAVQRAINILATEGWIGRDRDGKWQITPRILAIADAAFGGYALKHRARPTLETLRDVCGETVTIVLREEQRFVIADVMEGPAILRVVPPVGAPADLERSASGRAMIACLPACEQTQWLGRAPDAELLDHYAEARTRGYAISDRETDPGAVAVGAAIFDADGRPCGAVSVIAPHDRLSLDRRETIGQLVVRAARDLSLGQFHSDGRSYREPKA
ncbi:MAG: IclR family transcriptional regulator [Sphingobium sp.]